MKKKEIHEIINFVEKARELETTWRFSETLKGINESVADHSWRLTLMTFVVAEEKDIHVNMAHALKIAIVHDFAEALTGDIDAYHVITGKITQQEKEDNERKAIKKITKGFSFGKDIKHLWEEYVEKKSKEARFVRALDKLEAFLSVVEAGHKKYTQRVFYSNYADDAVRNFPELTDLLVAVKRKLKKELSQGKIKWIE